MTHFVGLFVGLIIFLIANTECVDQFQNYTKQMKDCYQKFIPTLNPCKQSVAKDWNCATKGDQTIELSCGSGEGRTCCPIWSLYECQRKAIKENCGQNLLKDFDLKVFDPQIKQIETKDCSKYKHLSKQCKSLLDFDQDQVVAPGEAPDETLTAKHMERGIEISQSTRLPEQSINSNDTLNGKTGDKSNNRAFHQLTLMEIVFKSNTIFIFDFIFSNYFPIIFQFIKF